MEAKEEEFIVTQEWLEEMKACEDGLQAFKKHFPNSKGVIVLEVLKKCAEINYVEFACWLIQRLPFSSKGTKVSELVNQLAALNYYTLAGELTNALRFNKKKLEFDNVDGHLFYNGNVHIKGDANTHTKIHTQGNLKIDGKLTASGEGYIYSNNVNATEIDLSDLASIFTRTRTPVNAININMRNDACISRDTVADSINLYDKAYIFGNAEAKVINFKGGRIYGNVDADNILNDGGYILGDVNTFTIENINGGKVDGKTTYKRSDEHK